MSSWSSNCSRQIFSAADTGLPDGRSHDQYRRLGIELGSGDGRMMRWLAASNPDMLVFGVEMDRNECDRLKSGGLPANAVLAEADCRYFIKSVADSSVDLVLALFPDPSLIDEPSQAQWLPFYHELFRKLKPGALFRLVTELTNDLFEPVSEAEFQNWTRWLGSLFTSVGFSVRISTGAPTEYSSRCLDQFRGDEQRIRIATFDLVRPKNG